MQASMIPREPQFGTIGDSCRGPRCLALVPVAALAVLLGACQVHLRGAVTQSDAGPELTEPEGRVRGLILADDAQPLAYLDGEGVELDGVARFGRVRVTDWRITDGTHGLQVFVGPLERRGVEVAVWDRNSGGVVLVDEAAAGALAAHSGQPVLIEGFVEGAQRVRVVYYRILAAQEHPQ